MENPVIIFGVGPMGRAAKEVFESNDVIVYGYLDDNKALHGQEIDDVVVLGSTDDDGFLKLIGKKCEAFIAIDENKLRKNLVEMIIEDRRVQPVNAIHKSSIISANAEIGHGNFIGAAVIIGTGAKIQDHCILNAGVVIGAEVMLGKFVQVGSGSVVNNNVIIEDEAFVGSGVTIISGVTIGRGARVGAGSVVISSVKPAATVFGNPAQPVKG